MTIKYAHFRYKQNGDLAAYRDRNYSLFGGFTVTTIIDSDENIYIGIAKCNRADRYQRSIGRIISRYRANRAMEHTSANHIIVMCESRLPNTILQYINEIGKKYKKEVTIIDPIHTRESGTPS